MLGGFPREDRRYTDPDEPLVGRCLTCGTVVTCLRRDARKGSGTEPGAWGDLLGTECPGKAGGKPCRARVFIMPAAEFRRVVEAARAGSSGTSVPTGTPGDRIDKPRYGTG